MLDKRLVTPYNPFSYIPNLLLITRRISPLNSQYDIVVRQSGKEKALVSLLKKLKLYLL
ncbi:hypothetical protein AAHB59_04330 [Bacillus cereus]